MLQIAQYQPGIDLVGITQQLQQFPIHSVRSLMLDSFISGYFCAINKQNKRESVELTLTVIEQLNLQLQDDLISIEDKINLYQVCVNENKDLFTQFDELEPLPQKQPQQQQQQFQLPVDLPPNLMQSQIRSAIGINKDCDICMDGLKLNQLFPMTACPHLFHVACVNEHLMTCIQGKKFPLGCPSCNVELHQQDLNELLDEHQQQLYQEMSLNHFLEGQMQQLTHCMTPDCNYAFLNPDKIAKLDCPVCRRSYCMKCNVPFHTRLTCEQYQLSLQPAVRQNIAQLDQQFIGLAQKERFQRCSKCRNWVEKNEVLNIMVNQGCDHITCRCGYEFCYLCGGPYSKCFCKGNNRREPIHRPPGFIPRLPPVRRQIVHRVKK